MFDNIAKFPEEWFFIRNASNGYVLMVDGGSHETGASLVISALRTKEYDAQLWKHDGQGRLYNKKSGQAIDVAKGSAKVGAELVQQIKLTGAPKDGDHDAQVLGFSTSGHIFLVHKPTLVLGIKESFFSRREGLHVHLQKAEKSQLDKKEQHWEFLHPTMKKSSSKSSVSLSLKKSVSVTSTGSSTGQRPLSREVSKIIEDADDRSVASSSSLDHENASASSSVFPDTAFFLKLQSTDLYIGAVSGSDNRLTMDPLRKHAYNTQLWTYDRATGRIVNKKSELFFSVNRNTSKEDQSICVSGAQDKDQSWIFSGDGELCLKDDPTSVVGLKEKWFGANRDGSHIYLQKKSNKSQLQKFKIVLPVFKKRTTEKGVHSVKEGSFPNDWFFIKSHAHGLVLSVLKSGDLAAEAVAIQLDTSNYTRQLWKYKDGFLVNKASNYVLDVKGGNIVQGAQIIQYEEKTTNSENQQWALTSEGCIYLKANNSFALSVHEGEKTKSHVFLSKLGTDDRKAQCWNFVLPVFKKKQQVKTSVVSSKKTVTHKYAQYPSGWFFIRSFAAGSTREKPLVLSASKEDSALHLTVISHEHWRLQLWSYINGSLVNYESNQAIDVNSVAGGALLNLSAYVEGKSQHWSLSVDGFLINDNEPTLTVAPKEGNDKGTYSVVLTDHHLCHDEHRWGLLLPEFHVKNGAQVLQHWSIAILREWRRKVSSVKDAFAEHAVWPQDSFYILTGDDLALVPSKAEAHSRLVAQKIDFEKSESYKWTFRNGYLVHCSTGLVLHAGGDSLDRLVAGSQLELRTELTKIDARQMWSVKTDGSIVSEHNESLGLGFAREGDTWYLKLVDLKTSRHLSWRLSYGRYNSSSILIGFERIILSIRRKETRKGASERQVVTRRVGLFPNNCWFFIRSKGDTSLVLTTSDKKKGAKLILAKVDFKIYRRQLWRYRDDRYLVNMDSDMVMDVGGGKLEPGSGVIQWREKLIRRYGKNQEWALSADGHIHPKSRPGLILSPKGDASKNGVAMQLHNRGDLSALYQQWQFATPVFGGASQSNIVQSMEDTTTQITDCKCHERVTKKTVIRRWGVFPEERFFVRCVVGNEHLSLTVDKKAQTVNGTTLHEVVLRPLNYKEYKWHMWYYDDGHLINVQTGLALDAQQVVAGLSLEEGLQMHAVVREQSMEDTQFWNLGINGEIHLRTNERLVVGAASSERVAFDGAQVGLNELRLQRTKEDGKEETMIVSETWHRWTFSVPVYGKATASSTVTATVTTSSNSEQVAASEEDREVEGSEAQTTVVQEAEESGDEHSESEDEADDHEEETAEDEQGEEEALEETLEEDFDTEQTESSDIVNASETVLTEDVQTLAVIKEQDSITEEKEAIAVAEEQVAESEETVKEIAAVTATTTAAAAAVAVAANAAGAKKTKRASLQARTTSYKLPDDYVPTGFEKVVRYKNQIGSFPSKGYFIIKSELHGYVLDVDGDALHGARVVVKPIRSTDYASQLWYFRDGYLYNLKGQKFVLDAAVEKLTSGERVRLSDRTENKEDAKDQLWEYANDTLIHLTAKRTLRLTVDEKRNQAGKETIDVCVRFENGFNHRKEIRREQRWEVLVPVLLPLSDKDLSLHRAALVKKTEENATAAILVAWLKSTIQYRWTVENQWPVAANWFLIKFGSENTYLAAGENETQVGLYQLTETNYKRFLWIYVNGYLINYEYKLRLALSESNQWILSRAPLEADAHTMSISEEGVISICIRTIVYYIRVVRHTTSSGYLLEMSKENGTPGVQIHIPTFSEANIEHEASISALAISDSIAKETELVNEKTSVVTTEESSTSSGAILAGGAAAAAVVAVAAEVANVVDQKDITKQVTENTSTVDVRYKTSSVIVKELRTIISAWSIVFIQRLRTCNTQHEYVAAIEEAKKTLHSRLERQASYYSTGSKVAVDSTEWQVAISRAKELYETDVFEKYLAKLKTFDTNQKIVITELNIAADIYTATGKFNSHVEQVLEKEKSTNVTEKVQESSEKTVVECQDSTDILLVAIDSIKVTVRYWFFGLYGKVCEATKTGASEKDIKALIQRSRAELDEEISQIQKSTQSSLTNVSDNKASMESFTKAIERSSSIVTQQVDIVCTEKPYVSEEKWTLISQMTEKQLSTELDEYQTTICSNSTEKIEEESESVEVDQEVAKAADLTVSTQIVETKEMISGYFTRILRSITWELEYSAQSENVRGRILDIVEAEKIEAIDKIDHALLIIRRHVGQLSFVERRRLEISLKSTRASLLANTEQFKSSISQSSDSTKDILKYTQCSFGKVAEQSVVGKIEKLNVTVVEETRAEGSLADELEIGSSITENQELLSGSKSHVDIKLEQTTVTAGETTTESAVTEEKTVQEEDKGLSKTEIIATGAAAAIAIGAAAAAAHHHHEDRKTEVKNEEQTVVHEKVATAVEEEQVSQVAETVQENTAEAIAFVVENESQKEAVVELHDKEKTVAVAEEVVTAVVVVEQEKPITTVSEEREKITTVLVDNDKTTVEELETVVTQHEEKKVSVVLEEQKSETLAPTLEDEKESKTVVAEEQENHVVIVKEQEKHEEQIVKEQEEQVVEEHEKQVVKEQEERVVEEHEKQIVEEQVNQEVEEQQKESAAIVVEKSETTTVHVEEIEKRHIPIAAEEQVATEKLQAVSQVESEKKKLIATGEAVALVVVTEHVRSSIHDWFARLNFKVAESAKEGYNDSEIEAEFTKHLSEAKRDLDVIVAKAKQEAGEDALDSGFSDYLTVIYNIVWNQTTRIKEIGHDLAKASYSSDSFDNSDYEVQLEMLTQSTLKDVNKEAIKYNISTTVTKVVDAESGTKSNNGILVTDVYIVDYLKVTIRSCYLSLIERVSARAKQGGPNASKDIEIMVSEAKEKIAVQLDQVSEKLNSSSNGDSLVEANETIQRVKERVAQDSVQVQTIAVAAAVAASCTGGFEELKKITETADAHIDTEFDRIDSKLTITVDADQSAKISSAKSVAIVHGVKEHGEIISTTSVVEMEESSILIFGWFKRLTSSVSDAIKKGGNTVEATTAVTQSAEKEIADIIARLQAQFELQLKNKNMDEVTRKALRKQHEEKILSIRTTTITHISEVQAITAHISESRSTEDVEAELLKLTEEKTEKLKIDLTEGLIVKDAKKEIQTDLVTTEEDQGVVVVGTEVTAVKQNIGSTEELTVIETQVIQSGQASSLPTVIEETKKVTETEASERISEALSTDSSICTVVDEQSAAKIKIGTEKEKAQVVGDVAYKDVQTKDHKAVVAGTLAAGVAAGIAMAITHEKSTEKTIIHPAIQDTRVKTTTWFTILYEKITIRIKQGGANVYSDIVGLVSEAEKELDTVVQEKTTKTENATVDEALVTVHQSIATQIATIKQTAQDMAKVESAGTVDEASREKLLVVCEGSKEHIESAFLATATVVATEEALSHEHIVAAAEKEIVKEINTVDTVSEVTRGPSETTVVVEEQRIQVVSPTTVQDVKAKFNAWLISLNEKLSANPKECSGNTSAEIKVIVEEAQKELQSTVAEAKKSYVVAEGNEKAVETDKDFASTLEWIQSVGTAQTTMIERIAIQGATDNVDVSSQIENAVLVSKQQIEGALEVHIEEVIDVSSPSKDEKVITVIQETKEQVQERMQGQMTVISVETTTRISRTLEILLTRVRETIQRGGETTQEDLKVLVETAKKETSGAIQEAKLKLISGEKATAATETSLEVTALAITAQKQVLDSLDFVKRNLESELSVLSEAVDTDDAQHVEEYLSETVTRTKQRVETSLTRTTDVAFAAAFEGKVVEWVETTKVPVSFDGVRYFAFDIVDTVVDYRKTIVQEWNAVIEHKCANFSHVNEETFVLRWYEEYVVEKSKSARGQSDYDLFKVVLLRLLKEQTLENALTDAEIKRLCMAWSRLGLYNEVGASVRHLKENEGTFAVSFSNTLSIPTMMEIARQNHVCWHAQFAKEMFTSDTESTVEGVAELLALEQPGQLAVVSADRSVLQAAKKQGNRTVLVNRHGGNSDADKDFDITFDGIDGLAESYQSFLVNANASKTLGKQGPAVDSRSWFQKVVDATVEALM